VAVLPLSRKPELTKVGHEIYRRLSAHHSTDFDDTQSIGRRYRRQDEIGTPWCVTIDFETLEDRAVTIRERDTLVQERVSLDRLEEAIEDRLSKVPRPHPQALEDAGLY
jgi:glycyl-tRNA synthetase